MTPRGDAHHFHQVDSELYARKYVYVRKYVQLFSDLIVRHFVSLSSYTHSLQETCLRSKMLLFFTTVEVITDVLRVTVVAAVEDLLTTSWFILDLIYFLLQDLSGCDVMALCTVPLHISAVFITIH